MAFLGSLVKAIVYWPSFEARGQLYQLKQRHKLSLSGLVEVAVRRLIAQQERPEVVEQLGGAGARELERSARRKALAAFKRHQARRTRAADVRGLLTLHQVAKASRYRQAKTLAPILQMSWKGVYKLLQKVESLP